MDGSSFIAGQIYRGCNENVANDKCYALTAGRGPELDCIRAMAFLWGYRTGSPQSVEMWIHNAENECAPAQWVTAMWGRLATQETLHASDIQSTIDALQGDLSAPLHMSLTGRTLYLLKLTEFYCEARKVFGTQLISGKSRAFGHFRQFYNNLARVAQQVLDLQDTKNQTDYSEVTTTNWKAVVAMLTEPTLEFCALCNTVGIDSVMASFE